MFQSHWLQIKVPATDSLTQTPSKTCISPDSSNPLFSDWPPQLASSYRRDKRGAPHTHTPPTAEATRGRHRTGGVIQSNTPLQSSCPAFSWALLPLPPAFAGHTHSSFSSHQPHSNLGKAGPLFFELLEHSRTIGHRKKRKEEKERNRLSWPLEVFFLRPADISLPSACLHIHRYTP